MFSVRLLTWLAIESTLANISDLTWIPRLELIPGTASCTWLARVKVTVLQSNLLLGLSCLQIPSAIMRGHN